MSDLGVTHLSVRQADVVFRCGQLRPRILGYKTVPVRGVGMEDRIIVAILAVAPAVQDAKDDRSRMSVIGPLVRG